MAPFDAAYAAPPVHTDAAIEATFTIEPPPVSSIAGIAAFEHTNTLRRFTWSTWSHFSSLVFQVSRSSPCTIPALFTRTSRPPSSSRAVATASAAVADEDTSPITRRAASPSAATTSRPRVSSRSTTTTRAPSREKSSTVARPKPDAPPVTIATLPSSRPTSAPTFFVSTISVADHEVVECRFAGHAPVVDQLPGHVGGDPTGVVVVVAVHLRVTPHELLVLRVDPLVVGVVHVR